MSAEKLGEREDLRRGGMPENVGRGGIYTGLRYCLTSRLNKSDSGWIRGKKSESRKRRQEGNRKISSKPVQCIQPILVAVHQKLTQHHKAL